MTYKCKPFSLTLVAGNLIQSVLGGSINCHVERHRHDREGQAGFDKGWTCLTNLTAFFKYVTRKVHEGNALEVAYMDFSNAIDKITHDRLVRTSPLNKG